MIRVPFSVLSERQRLADLLRYCSKNLLLGNGVQVHGAVLKMGFGLDLMLSNDLIGMYSKCGQMNNARVVFNKMPDRNVVSWTSLMCGFLQNGDAKASLSLFSQMGSSSVKPNEFTFSTNIKASGVLSCIETGTQIQGALVDFYVKCGCLLEARRVFDQIEQKNVICWSALILGYAQEENLAEAMDVFNKLRESGVQVDGFVLSSMTGVFADFALVEQGKQIHAYAIKIPSGLDISVLNSIVDMYLKCGLIDEAEKLFSEMPARNVVSWTVMITGYGKHGLGKEAVGFFNKMQLDNIEPDEAELDA
ncbi:hypothetical protein QYF36_003655 [Acer negundo]|nr:hypothetical protein QYF36_003655 [Acer negundo]